MDDKNLLPKLQKIYKFVLKSRRSDFYRKKYSDQNFPQVIKNLEDFYQIPFLTKDELIKTGPLDSLFIPEKEVVYIRPTSGTTKNKALIMLFAPASQEFIQKYLYQPLKELGVERALV